MHLINIINYIISKKLNIKKKNKNRIKINIIQGISSNSISFPFSKSSTA